MHRSDQWGNGYRGYEAWQFYRHISIILDVPDCRETKKTLHKQIQVKLEIDCYDSLYGPRRLQVRNGVMTVRDQLQSSH